MFPENSQTSFAKTIKEVTTILGLSSLGLLATGAALTAVLVKTPQDRQFPTFVVMATLVLVVVFANMIYAYVMQKLELTFRVRVEKAQDEDPLVDVQVDLYKNGKLVQSSSTDDFGLLAFTVKLERKDELYVVVIQNGTQSNKAALYSSGQCQMTKTIRL